jgi:hypothetical protein
MDGFIHSSKEMCMAVFATHIKESKGEYMERTKRRLLGAGLVVFGAATIFATVQVANREVNSEFATIQQVIKGAIEDAQWNREHYPSVRSSGAYVPTCNTAGISELLGGLIIVTGAIMFIKKSKDKDVGTPAKTTIAG